MRRLISVVLALVGLAVLTALPAAAAPSNGANTELIPINCGGENLFVLVGRGNPAWGTNASGTLDGSKFAVRSLTVRVYPGTLTTEPSTPPVFSFTKNFGNKTGLGDSITCTFVEVEEDGSATGFGTVIAVQVR